VWMPGTGADAILPAVLIGGCAGAILVLNVGHPKVIEVMTSVAIVWANLAYLFVTVPMLLGRLRRWRTGSPPGRTAPSGWAAPGCRSTCWRWPGA